MLFHQRWLRLPGAAIATRPAEAEHSRRASGRRSPHEFSGTQELRPSSGLCLILRAVSVRGSDFPDKDVTATALWTCWNLSRDIGLWFFRSTSAFFFSLLCKFGRNLEEGYFSHFDFSPPTVLCPNGLTETWREVLGPVT